MATPEIDINLDVTGLFMKVEDLDDADNIEPNKILVEEWANDDPFKFLRQLEQFMALNLKCYKVALRKSQHMAQLLQIEDDPEFKRRISRVLSHDEKLTLLAHVSKMLANAVDSDE